MCAAHTGIRGLQGNRFKVSRNHAVHARAVFYGWSPRVGLPPCNASAVGSKDWIDHDPSRWMESARAVAESGAPLTRPRRAIRLNESCVQPANGSKQERRYVR